jgi:hypothetical protein
VTYIIDLNDFQLGVLAFLYLLELRRLATLTSHACLLFTVIENCCEFSRDIELPLRCLADCPDAFILEHLDDVLLNSACQVFNVCRWSCVDQFVPVD